MILFSITNCPYSKPHSGGGPGEDCGLSLIFIFYRAPNESIEEYDLRKNALFLQYYKCMTKGNE